MLKPVLALLTLALILGNSQLVSQADTDHGHSPNHDMGSRPDMNGSHGDSHHHSTLEIPDGQPKPTVTLMIYPDPVQGWNLEVQTTNFQFAPEQVNQANQPNQGHGHIYINGEKISRIYGPWLHLPELPSGTNEITIGLNANSHETFTHNGQKIESTVVVEVP